MPYEPTEFAAMGIHRPYPLTVASAIERAIGVSLDATATAVAAPGSATVTLTVLDGDIGQLRVGDFLDCDTGALYERVQITGANPTAFQVTATFANTHAANFAVRVAHGTFLGVTAIPQAGTAMILSLYDGHPSRPGLIAEQVAAPAAPTLGQQAGGTFAAGAVVNVALTWVTPGGGETPASAPAQVTISTLNNEVTVTVPALPQGVSGANVYVNSVSAGATLYRYASNQAAGTVLVTAFASAAAAQPPTVNGTHLPFFQWVSASGVQIPTMVQAALKRGLYAIYSGTTPGWVTLTAKAMIR